MNNNKFKKIMKKAIVVSCTAALLTLSLAGCTSKTTVTDSKDTVITTDYSGSTIYGEVTAVDGDQITLTLGTSTDQMKDQMMGGDSMGGGFDDLDDSSSSTDSSSTSGTNDSTTTDDQSQNQGTQMTPPSDGQGTAPTDQSNTNNDGTQPTMPGNNDNHNGGMGKGGFSGFYPGTTKATITISDESLISVIEATTTTDTQSSSGDASKGSLSSMKEGSILQITFDDDGNISAIVVRGDLTSNN